MKAITLWQPWASLVAAEIKHFETRSWSTSHRGCLAIHAAGRWNAKMMNDARDVVAEIAVACAGSVTYSESLNYIRMALKHYGVDEKRDVWPTGVIVAIVDLVGVEKMTAEMIAGVPADLFSESQLEPHLRKHAEVQRRVERVVGNWKPGRFAWRFENVRVVNPPVKATGKQGLWDVEL